MIRKGEEGNLMTSLQSLIQSLYKVYIYIGFLIKEKVFQICALLRAKLIRVVCSFFSTAAIVWVMSSLKGKGSYIFFF